MPDYPWLRVFLQAQDESDVSNLHARVLDAETAINARLKELRANGGADVETQTEFQQIFAAMQGLTRIKSEKLKWPMRGLEDFSGGKAR